MGRKGASQLFWLIMVAAIALIAGILIIVWFNTSGGKAFRSVDTQLDALGDYDNDHVANGFDKCPCTAVGSEEQAGWRGCPRGTTPDQATSDQQKFKENKCAEVAATSAEPPAPLYLEISTTLAPESYETTSNYLRYKFTCPSSTSCLLRIGKPDGSSEDDIQPEATNDLMLGAPGGYHLDLYDESNNLLKSITVTKK
jgi:hypothetical protein